jgi:hypothetical protein
MDYLRGDDDLELTLGEVPEVSPVTDANSPFFFNKKAAAVLKHEILRQYVVPFVSKVGSTSVGSRVVYLDGYAGPGTYADGTPASPSLVLGSASEVSEFREMECFFVEKTRKDFARLQVVVEEARSRGIKAEALPGRVQKHLDYVLEKAEGVPLLAFLDPFGLGIPFDDLTEKFFGSHRPQNRDGWIPTEVLLNFSANAVRRIGGLLTTTKEVKGPKRQPFRHSMQPVGEPGGAIFISLRKTTVRLLSESPWASRNGCARKRRLAHGSSPYAIDPITNLYITWCSLPAMRPACGCSVKRTPLRKRHGAKSVHLHLQRTPRSIYSVICRLPLRKKKRTAKMVGFRTSPKTLRQC